MEKLNLPKINTEIVEYWKKIHAFEKSLQITQSNPKFIFYDGPPFATGLPHYGHLLASTLKDIIPRYKSQTGYYVERIWGWDCHGLPIEYEIEKELGIKTKQQIIDYTIPAYNDKCAEIVLKYSSEWQKTIELLGRWVDYQNQWKTMDIQFMESVWWIFKQIFDKQLVYQGFKVMPYSTSCHTPLSNFEAQSNYKNVLDYSLTVMFQLTSQSVEFLRNQLQISTLNRLSILVWTTTPWTLPSNLAICLSPNLSYAIVSSNDNYYLIAKECINRYFNEGDYQLISLLETQVLKNLQYEPLYKYYQHHDNAFKLLVDSYVSSEKGTGCVHLAPAFGQDDYRVCIDMGIIDKKSLPPCPIDCNGHFQYPVDKYKDLYFKDAEKMIVEDLKRNSCVFKVSKELHEYPHCWRSETPLIYMVVPSWFIAVSQLKEKLIDLNKNIQWSPQPIGENRFGNWLESAQDWCVSRNRYWGTPIPLWVNEDLTEIVCVGSVAELEKLAQLPTGSITNLHTHVIDNIQIPSPQGNGFLKRIDEVFDCWFESGCMPYAHIHYPFKNCDTENGLPNQYPADFIAEGLDQTRGWFYTLHVISTILFDQPAFKNVIVNGLILAEDGRKMSKKEKNYPPPENILDTYGADALRLYFVNSDVVQAEPLLFNEKEIRRLVQIFFIPYHNSVNFLVDMIKHYSLTNNCDFKIDSNLENIKLDNLDILLLIHTNDLIQKIHRDMDKYKLNQITNHFIKMIDIVSRVYIKLKKSEIKQMNSSQVYVSLNVLYYCLYLLTLMLAPFAPFITEYYYLKVFKGHLSQMDSIHLIQLPKDLNKTIEKQMPKADMEHLTETSKYFMLLLDMGRSLREKLPFQYKRPLKSLTIINNDDNVINSIQTYHDYLLEELNTLQIIYEKDDNQYIGWSVSLNFKKIAQAGHKNLVKSLNDYVKNNQKLVYKQLSQNQSLEFGQYQLNQDLFIIDKVANKIDNQSINIAINNDFIMIADLEFNQSIEYLYELRQLTRALNQYRKSCGLTINDIVTGQYQIVDKTQEITLNIENLKKDLFSKTKIHFEQDESDVNGGQLFESYKSKIRIHLVS